MTQNDRYRYVYDGFGRLVALKDASGNPIATYGYNGLGFRIWEQPNGGGGGGKRFFCYDERWRIVATFDDTNATPTRRVIHHAAGVGGAAAMGGSLYIESVILSAPHIANDDTADAALETRVYPLQNWRADVVCVGKLNSGAFQLVEVVDYDTYGNAVSRPPVSADFNQNGGLDTDFGDFYAAYELGEPEADADLDGGITSNDVVVFNAAFEAGVFGPSRGAGAYSGVIAGYAGYVRDRFVVGGDLYHVRYRVYDVLSGRFLTRDPVGYMDGMSVYAYVNGNPYFYTDPYGLYGIGDWWHDFGEGWDVLTDYWSKPPRVKQIIRDMTDKDALDEVQDALDTCACVPIAGQAADIVNSGISLCRGEYATAVCSLAPGPSGPLKKVPGLKPPGTLKPWTPPGLAPNLGPSGKPKRHFPMYPSRKKAYEAAKCKSSKGKQPMEHTNPVIGRPHFHPVDKSGEKVPGPHFEYPW